jgi:two-component system, OmpR family, phosphate regulon sensor histidine kinase PhoR
VTFEFANLNLLNKAINGLQAGVVLWQDNKLLAINKAACGLLGLPKDSQADIKIEDSPYWQSLQALLQVKEDSYSKQLTGIVGKPLNATIHFVEDLLLLELSESYETRLGEASHELRRPLSNVKTLVDTLHLWGAAEDPEARKKFLTQLHSEVNRLSKLVEELLNLSRLQAGAIPLEVHQVALRVMVQEAMDMLAEQASEKNIKLQNNIPADFVLIADVDKLTHVVQNLIENGIRYNLPDGTVSVNPITNNLSFCVEDTGKGIAAENIPFIFERFKRFNKEVAGTGLGLAIVKSIVDLHGGKLTVTSVLGIGSKFIVEIPPKDIALPLL